MSTLNNKTLSLTPGQRIELYTLDLGIADGPVIRFTPNREWYVPGRVTRLTDASTSAVVSAGIPMGALTVGTVLVFSGYMRSSGPETWFPCFTITPAVGETTNYFRWRVRLDTLACNTQNSSPYVGNTSFTFTVAGEWIYFRLQCTVTTAMPAAHWHMRPAFGPVASFPANSQTLTGELDLTGLSIQRKEGSMLLPLVTDMDPFGENPWVGAPSAASVINSEAPNAYEVVKVPVWQGQPYTPLPIKATGFEKTGNGAFPKPLLQMSNLTGVGSLIMQQYGDIRGAEVRRVRLYADNLDNGPDPDPAAAYAPDVFTLVRRSHQDSQMIEFELASKLDQQGVQLPRRQILRDVCPWKYRAWNPDLNSGAGGFDYSKATCPYTGPAMFDMNGNAVTNGAEDQCSQSLKLGCRKRYGKTEEMPFGGFPMVGRFG